MSEQCEKINYITFSKGLAMLGIFLSHAPQRIEWIDNKWTAWGANGVKLLFLITAFLTTNSYYQKDFSIIKFYKKRIWRLAPLYWCAILFWHIIYIFDKEKVITVFMSEHDPLAILLNIFLLNGIFVHGNNTVVPGGWYVGTSVIFYLLAPLIIPGINLVWKRSVWFARFLPLMAFGCVYLVSWSMNHISFFEKISTVLVVYYSILFQMPALILGVNMWFELKSRANFEKTNIKLMLYIIAVGLAIWYSTYVNYDFGYLSWTYMAGLIFIVCRNNEKMLSNCNVIMHLGNMSYEFFWFI